MLSYICYIGGAKGGGYTYDGPPVVFDLTKMQWVTTYTPPDYLLNAPKTTSASSPPGPGVTSSGPQISSPTEVPSAKDSNLGAILGGTFGSVFVIALAALIYIYLLRRKDKVEYTAPAEQRSDRDDKGLDQRALEGHGRRDPQEITGLNPQSLDRGPMYAVNLDPKDYAANSVVTTPGTNYHINPGVVPTNNVPMLYAPHPGCTAPVAPGGVILLPNGQQANVVYLTQHPGPVIQPQAPNGTIFNTNMASYGNNTIPVSQVAFSNGAIYNTSPMPPSPTTTQYMDGFVPLANPPQHITPIASVAHHARMPVQAPLTVQHYGTPESVAPAPSLVREGSELSSTVQNSPHDRHAYVGGQSTSSLNRSRNNRHRSSSIDSEPKSAPSSATVFPSPSQEGSQYYTAFVPGFEPGETSEVNVNPDQNQSYWLPPPIPPRIS